RRLVPNPLRVGPGGNELVDATDHAIAVFSIGNAEPGGTRAQNAEARGVRAAKAIIDDGGNVEFGLQVLDVVAKKLGELGLQGVEDCGSESEEVHADGFGTVKGNVATCCSSADDASRGYLDFRVLLNAFQISVGGNPANAPGDRTVLADRLSELVADHTHF